jgi:hypothetical protein
MKKSKIVLLVILLLLIFVLSGCATKTESTANTKEENYKAILLLPDGTIIKGTCTDYKRASANWLIATIDGITYRLNDWRVVLIEGDTTEVE